MLEANAQFLRKIPYNFESLSTPPGPALIQLKLWHLIHAFVGSFIDVKKSKIISILKKINLIRKRKINKQSHKNNYK